MNNRGDILEGGGVDNIGGIRGEDIIEVGGRPGEPG